MTPTTHDPHQLVGAIKSRARALGFDLVGIAPASPSSRADYFRNWLDSGQAGEMQYLAERIDERIDPAIYFSGARSVICVAVNYNPGQGGSVSGAGRVARYAWGDDYHEHIKPRLYDLADWLRDTVPGCRTRCGLDTVPVMEKELAARAGIGWMGKHTCVINEQIGSWLLLGEVLTTLDLPSDAPAADRCGTCTRCIDACPTGAITGAYQLDATRCISYLTIEHSGPIDQQLQQKLGDWVFGCDICQEVCPWNSGAPIASDQRSRGRILDGTMPLRDILDWREHEPNPTISGTAIKRVKLPVLQRNARIVAANQEGMTT